MLQTGVLADLMATARGDDAPDMIVSGGQVVNVFLGEPEPVDILIRHGRVAGLRETGSIPDDFEGEVIDAAGRFVVPGLIDSHYHVGGTHLDISQLSTALLARGTTTIATDFYEIYTMAGPAGVRWALDEAKRHGLRILYLPPAHLIGLEKVGTFGWDVSVDDMIEMLQWPEAVGVMEPPAAAVLTGDPDMMRVLEETVRLKKIFAGHAPGETELRLQAYIATGASSEHESQQADEALEKLRYGMRPMMRESSAAPNLASLIELVNRHPAASRYMMLCSDETDPADLIDKGHMDNKVRMAITHGVDPVTAVQMATINVAEYFGVAGEIGSLSPGKMADLVIVDDLESFRPVETLAQGRPTGESEASSRSASPPEGVVSKINTPASLTAEDFVVPVPTEGGKGSVSVRVVGVVDGSLVSEPRERRLEVSNGEIKPRPEDDVLKIAVVERHRASGRIGKGFVEGFGFRDGAVAMTYCHVFHNLLVIGSEDSLMAKAANAVAEMGGGVAVVARDEVMATWRLPVVGVMGEKPLDEARRAFDQTNEALRSIGCELSSPILSLSFIALPTIPAYGLSDQGLFDVQGQRFVDVVVSD